MRRKQQYIALAVTLILLTAMLYFLWTSGLADILTSKTKLEEFLVGYAPYTHIVFFVLQFISVVIAPIPSNISATVGGVIFGTWPAFFITMAAVFSGSALVFLLSRKLGKDFVDRVVGEKMSEKFADTLHKKTDIFLFLAFLFPFFPDDILCILAGMTTISTKKFLIILACTRPWGLLFASGIGNSITSLTPTNVALSAVVVAVLFYFGMKYGDKVQDYVLEKLKQK